jgi:malate synthase
MPQRIECAGLQVDEALHKLLVNEIAPGTGIDPDTFWQGVADIWSSLGPVNERLLAERESLQAQIDHWHKDHRSKGFDSIKYQAFLREIGYLHPEPEAFSITTENVDPEVARVAGPQLVVPVMNARYALNAANARWGSLYDALYGTNAIAEEGGAERTVNYNPVRGAKVIAWARAFLDEHCPLVDGSHSDASAYSISKGALTVSQTGGNRSASLLNASQFIGFTGCAERPESVLLKHNGLHIEIQIDRSHPVGATDAAGVKDVCLESALTTIQDCEDSVAAVDADDKVTVYRNWLGLMKGDLADTFDKGGESVVRRLHPDREFKNPDGEPFSLPGRSLLFVRNVGHLMTSSAILDAKGNEIPEGFMDGLFTTFCALHDLQEERAIKNSRAGSMYIVKPKMHGPEEVSLTVELFSQIEQLFGLSPNTLKVGIMDEERRTTVNLAECIRRASERVVFINTGFLDRTGDEIHTSMEAGAVAAKTAMKAETWINAYEDWNVDIGLACGLQGKAQIGKGMWAMPDLMAEMLTEKIAHPSSGANCAWVPSPTAATLHATHYHSASVADIQREIAGKQRRSLEELLTIPLGSPNQMSADKIQHELDNNAQGILGYVVRWVEHGVGCSKVRDINDVGLMEDRATLRISSQHISNWLHHGVVSEKQVRDTLSRMAAVVDEQNKADPDYRPMTNDLNASLAFQAACELVFAGTTQPNGYTEPVLHRYRLAFKDQTAD